MLSKNKQANPNTYRYYVSRETVFLCTLVKSMTLVSSFYLFPPVLNHV